MNRKQRVFYLTSLHQELGTMNPRLELEFDRLRTLGLSKEVDIVLDTLRLNRNKDKTYLLALARVKKFL